MALHIIKLAAGADGVEELKRRIRNSVEANTMAGLGRAHTHETRMFPKRRDELLSGGSLYWVIKGTVLVRQLIIDLATQTGNDGVDRCLIVLDPNLIPTEAQSRRAFQGWRYLADEDAPRDLPKAQSGATPALRAKLAELGLL